MDRERLEDELLAARAESIAAERERCAKIAEAYGINDPHIAIVWQTAQQIAAAIREAKS